MSISMPLFASWVIVELQPITRRRLFVERVTPCNYAIFAEFPRNHRSPNAAPLEVKVVQFSKSKQKYWYNRIPLRTIRIHATINGKNPKFEEILNPSKEKARFIANRIQEELPFLRESSLQMLLSGFEKGDFNEDSRLAHE